MPTEEQAQQQPNPSELAGQAKARHPASLQGQAYAAIGSVLPEGQAESWIKSGEELQRAGETEINNAKQKQAVESAIDGASAKIKSAVGYVTGNQERQNEGNIENEKAQWKYKHATSDSILGGVPVPSAEGVKGKLESVEGMITGDQGKQQEGNIRAEKAAWKDGV